MPLPQNRIEHVVVLMLENRSFDHLFGFFQPAAGQTCENLLGGSAFANRLDPDKPVSASNPEFRAKQPAPFAVHDKDGPAHSFNAVNLQLSNQKAGPSAQHPVKNNGFVRSYRDKLLASSHTIEPDRIAEVMQCFGPSQLPAINQLAHEFCLCDHWFCEVPGPTMPNRMYIHAATSEGYVHNAFDRDFHSKTVYELVAARHLSWCTYFHDFNEVLQFKSLGHSTTHFRRFEDCWKTDVAHGQLPHYSFILPRFVNAPAGHGLPARPANSQHAPEDARHAEHLIADVYDALAANQALFRKTLLIVTYDEHGGFFDHVHPAAAVSPDGLNSPNPDDTAPFAVPSFAFDRIGLRVPTLLVSPWIRKGTIEHRPLQHTSVISTVRDLFGLGGPLNHRDAQAQSFADVVTHLATPRAALSMPAALTRPPITAAVKSTVAGVEIEPPDEPLDDLTTAWMQGFARLVARRTAADGAPVKAVAAEAPATHAEASAVIDQLWQRLGI